MWRVFLVVFGVSWIPTTALATADGPDFWRVVGTAENDVLNLRDGPGVKYKIVEKIPHNGRRLKNLGECTQHKGKPSWCKIQFRTTAGWAAARYLREDSEGTSDATADLFMDRSYHYDAHDPATSHPSFDVSQTLKFKAEGTGEMIYEGRYKFKWTRLPDDNGVKVIAITEYTDARDPDGNVSKSELGPVKDFRLKVGKDGKSLIRAASGAIFLLQVP